MKIAQVTEYFAPWAGGISEHVRYLTRELEALGHEVHVLTSQHRRGGAPLDQELEPRTHRFGTAVPLPYNGSVANINKIQFARSTVFIDSIYSNTYRTFARVAAFLPPPFSNSPFTTSTQTEIGLVQKVGKNIHRHKMVTDIVFFRLYSAKKQGLPVLHGYLCVQVVMSRLIHHHHQFPGLLLQNPFEGCKGVSEWIPGTHKMYDSTNSPAGKAVAIRRLRPFESPPVVVEPCRIGAIFSKTNGPVPWDYPNGFSSAEGPYTDGTDKSFRRKYTPS